MRYQYAALGEFDLRKTFNLVVFVAVFTVSQPAFADEFMAVTPSGRSETLFDLSAQATADRLASKCVDAGWTIISTTETVVICEAPMNFGQSLLGTMLMGNSYSTPPRSFYRFNVAHVQSVSRVQASGWMELQMAFGQTRRTDFSGASFHNGAMNFMVAAGGRLPPGTTFPNHVVVGVELDENVSKEGVRVKRVEPGSPGEAAGLKEGDMITALARKRIDSADDWFDGAAKAAKTETYEVDITRSGEKQRLTARRSFRPAVTAPAIAPQANLANSNNSPGSEMSYPVGSQTISIADEIAKLAKLRDDGIITESEFIKQKEKLLAAN